MYFLFIKIVDIDYKEDVTMALESVGITKASYIESWNLEKSLTDEILLFTGFFQREKIGQQIIITALAEEKDQVHKLLETLRIAGLDIDHKEILRVVLMPVEMVFDWDMGLKEF
ncbi:MAG TPA: hypothetical protein VMW73_11160 [Spirochaetia bacterium]|nr:hypothetical protein [Spirochaetia bacterium]